MDLGISIFAEVASLASKLILILTELVHSLVGVLVEAFVELIVLILELVLQLAAYFWPAKKQQAKISSGSRLMLRRSIYAVLVISALGVVVYFFGFRTRQSEPPPRSSSPSKIENARRAIEKIKELLPPKSPS